MRPPRPFLSACIILLLIAGIFSAGCADPGLPTSRTSEAANSGELYVYFLDVGQGDSSLIVFRNNVILIDAGEADQGDRVVSDLRKLGVDHIDLLVATHPHSDHIGGMQKILAAYPVEKVLDAGIPRTSPLYEHFLDTIDEENITYIVAEQGRTIDPVPALRLLVLSPPEERLDGDLNANSIVLKISYGTISFLFTGDAGTAAESSLLATGYSPAAQVLKVAHHGSSDATSPAFLSRVHPEVAVISLSGDNPYGYPHRETIAALQEAGTAIFRTDRDGTVLIRSNGTLYSVMTENGKGGIWVSPFLQSPATGMTTPPPPVSLPLAAVTIPALPPVPPAVTIPAVPPLPPGITIPVPPVSIPSVQIGNASLVKIEAIQFNAPGDDRENLNGEWVRIANSGDGPVLIAGWTLSDMSGADPYTFPAFLLMSRASVTVFTGSGIMNDTALFMGRTEPVWGNSGDTAFLRDGRGEIIDRRSS